ncbi:MAG: asparagine synthase [Thermoplasmata archaeon]|nr:MAG: asparagine synthase [Thermoplasmata archaeon]
MPSASPKKIKKEGLLGDSSPNNITLINGTGEGLMEEHIDKFEELLTDSIQSNLEGFASPAVAYSGGLDCSVIAKIAMESHSVKLVAVGTEDSQDLQAARLGSELLGLPLERIIVMKAEVEDAIPDIIDILKSRNALEISIELSLYFVCKHTRNDLILTGQGADELFGGYSRYLRLGSDEQKVRMKQDLSDYLQYNKPQELKLGKAFGKRIAMPYTASQIVEFIEQLPIDTKIRKSERKVVLKELARRLELAPEIINRPKKAVQYGSGILSIMKNLARREGVELHEYLKRI